MHSPSCSNNTGKVVDPEEPACLVGDGIRNFSVYTLIRICRLYGHHARVRRNVFRDGCHVFGGIIICRIVWRSIRKTVMCVRFDVLILHEDRSIVVDVQHNHSEITARFPTWSSPVLGQNRQYIFGYGLAIQIWHWQYTGRWIQSELGTNIAAWKREWN